MSWGCICVKKIFWSFFENTIENIQKKNLVIEIIDEHNEYED